jgi:hypothetical protein
MLPSIRGWSAVAVAAIALSFLLAGVAGATPFLVIFEELDQPLCTLGGQFYPDSTPVWIYWDRDGDGPCSQDQLPPLADSASHPDGSVNLNCFPINGGSLLEQPGCFITNDCFTTPQESLARPWQFYLVAAYGGDTLRSQVWSFQEGGVMEVECSGWHRQTESTSQRGQLSLKPTSSLALVGSDAIVTTSVPTSVELVLYNVLGQRCATVLRGNMPAGTRRVSMPPNLSAGWYVLRLATPANVVSVPMVRP